MSAGCVKKATLKQLKDKTVLVTHAGDITVFRETINTMSKGEHINTVFLSPFLNHFQINPPSSTPLKTSFSKSHTQKGSAQSAKTALLKSLCWQTNRGHGKR